MPHDFEEVLDRIREECDAIEDVAEGTGVEIGILLSALKLLGAIRNVCDSEILSEDDEELEPISDRGDGEG